ncbi:MAG: hypothetical protein KatS3mg109_0026 [Pirellulaceae bacterium]|nr:MAG: hypothetical protein KatS3mg109_0026 [Pirellulaceae bacterium]
MADILGRQLSQLKGSYSLDDLRVTVPGDSGQTFDAFLVLSVQIGYNQQISRVYGINDNGVILTSGRTQGTSSFNQVVGPKMSMVEFFSRYGSVCRAVDNTITLRMNSGCRDAGGGQRASAGEVDLIMAYCTIPDLSFSVTSDNALVTNSFNMTFESLELRER